MELPNFPYHPDPIATGSIKPSNAACACCGRVTGYIYTGPVYSSEDLSGGICPWCIADGSAHLKFDAEFVDAAGVGDYGSWEEIPEAVVAEIAYQTPGFSGWQQERWWTHCGDAAEFLGPVGITEAKSLGTSFLASVREETGFSSEAEWDNFLASLDKHHGPTAYAFRCRHCGKLGGYSDCH